MRKSTVMLTAGLWLMALTNLWLLMRLDEERAQNAALRTRDELWSEAKTLPDQPARLASHTDGTAVVVENAPPLPAPKSVPSTPTRSRDATEDWQAHERRMLSEPAYRDARKEQRRLEMSKWREDAIRLIGMTPEQADKALDVQIESEFASSTWPNPRDVAEMKQRMHDIEAANQRELVELSEFLGETKARQWHEYLASQPTRYEVARLRTQLLSTPSPLREEQIEPLVSGLHVEREQLARQMNEFYVSLDWDEANRENSSAEYARRVEELTAQMQERSRSAASAILSQDQLAAYDAMLRHQRELNDARTRMFRTRSAAKQAAVPKTP